MNYFDILYLGTTPLYLLAVHFLFLSKFEVKKSPILFNIYVVYGLALFLLHLMVKIPIVTFVVNFVFQGILSCFYTSNVPQRFSSVIQMMAILLGFETACGFSFGVMQVTIFTRNDLDSMVGIVISRCLLGVISFQLYQKKHKQNLDYPLSSHYYFIFSSIMIGLLLIYFMTATQPNLSTFHLILCSFSLLMVVSLILYLEDKTQKMYQYYIENIILREQSVAMENQRELMKQSLHTTKAIRHDVKNQMLVLLSLGENENYEEMIAQLKQMLEEVDDSKVIASTGHMVIDSLLNYKLNQQENISFHINLNVSEDLPILAYDLTVILGNLLDNAITAVNHLEKNKNITIFIECTKGNFILIMENTFQGNVLFENGLYHSTKPFSASHGFGVENVKRTVEKYHGSMDLTHGSEKFKVSIVIPI